MSGYIGSKTSVTLVDGYTQAEADAEFVQDPNGSITVSGSNVGIGTSSPSADLTLGAGGRGRFYRSDDTRYGDIFTDNDAFKFVTSTDPIVFNPAAGGTRFQNAGTEAMRIDSSGNLLVGTTGLDSSRLQVVSPSTTNNMATFKTSTAYGNIAFFNSSGGQVGYIQTNATSTGYVSSSDYRLKTDAQPMTGASARVQALNPVNFEWIASGDRVDGFLAHEAQEVVPECATGTKDAMRDEEYEVTPASLDDDGNVVTEAVMGTRSVPDYQGIDQSKLVPLLTAALQEALTKIDDMETRLAALEAV
jgi:hypothetical protein